MEYKILQILHKTALPSVSLQAAFPRTALMLSSFCVFALISGSSTTSVRKNWEVGSEKSVDRDKNEMPGCHDVEPTAF